MIEKFVDIIKVFPEKKEIYLVECDYCLYKFSTRPTYSSSVGIQQFQAKAKLITIAGSDKRLLVSSGVGISLSIGNVPADFFDRPHKPTEVCFPRRPDFKTILPPSSFYQSDKKVGIVTDCEIKSRLTGYERKVVFDIL